MKVQHLFSLSMFTLALLGAAATPAFASRGGVRVDCNGSCGLINLGDVCNAYGPTAVPVFVSCQHANTPDTHGVCGWPPGISGPTCHGGSNLARTLSLKMCIDGSGFDALVTCEK
jgi:hypothetical protein